jgi:uncharacterized membrane protein
MSMQKLVMGSVIGAVLLFALGYVIFDVLFLDYYAANAGAAAAGLRESQIYWAIILGSLGYGALVTYVVSKQGGPATLAGGLKGGALAGFLVWVMADFTIYGYLDLWNLTVTVLDIVLETVRAAITGAVISLVLAKIPA